jgi:hypothetical protein
VIYICEGDERREAQTPPRRDTPKLLAMMREVDPTEVEFEESAADKSKKA